MILRTERATAPIQKKISTLKHKCLEFNIQSTKIDVSKFRKFMTVFPEICLKICSHFRAEKYLSVYLK